MAILAVDEVMLREPRLLRPGGQPLGLCRLHRNHPLARDLVFFWYGGSEVELVTQTKKTISGGGAIRIPLQGNLAAEAYDTGDDSVSFALPASAGLYTITNQHSIAVKARVDAVVSYSSIVCVPYAAGSWAAPFASFAFSNYSTSYIRSWGAISSGAVFSLGDSTQIIAANAMPVFYGMTRNAADRVFYIGNGVFAGGSAASDANTTASIDWNTKQPVTLLNRSSTAAGEGVDGAMEYCAIWKRPLLVDEMRAFRSDPYSVIAPA